MVKKLKRQAAWAVSAFSDAFARYSFATINGAHLMRRLGVIPRGVCITLRPLRLCALAGG
jgi:hypothetical protein